MIVLTSAADNVVSESVTLKSLSKPIAVLLVTAVLTSSAVLLVIAVIVAASILTEVLPFNEFKSDADAEVALSTNVKASFEVAFDNAVLRSATAPVAVTVAVTMPDV